HLELGDCSIGNEAIEEIASNYTNLKYLSLKGCRRISNEVLKNLNPKIKIEHPDYSDDEFSDSGLPPLILIFTSKQNRIAITRSFRDYYLSHTLDETDLISAIVNYLRENPPIGKNPSKSINRYNIKSNTISKRLYNKLEKDYGLEGISGDDLISKEIKCLDLQFRYKGKWRSLDSTEVIDFQIRKNSSFDLVLGWDWLWMRKAKISFGFSLENYSRPTGDSSSHKASSTKNNLSIAEQAILWNNGTYVSRRFSESWDFVPKSTESKSGLAQEK
ncbi:5260_t:CDS:2, partial [Dentiscutata erythropus]